MLDSVLNFLFFLVSLRPHMFFAFPQTHCIDSNSCTNNFNFLNIKYGRMPHKLKIVPVVSSVQPWISED